MSVSLYKPIWHGASTCAHCPQIYADSAFTSACRRENTITSNYATAGIKAGYEPSRGLCMDAKMPFGMQRATSGKKLDARA